MSLLGALLSVAALCAGPPAPDATLGFADHLYEGGDYYRAIGEYERWLYENPGAAGAGRARIQIGLAYLRGGRAAEAGDWFESLAEESHDPQVRLVAAFEAAESRYRQGDAQAAALAFESFLSPGPLRPPAALRSRAGWLLGWSYLLAREPARAGATFERLREDPVFGPQARSLAAETVRARDLPRRSPALAGILSAVVPGSGYFYLGQPTTALAALAWNGLFGSGVYDAARHQLWGVTAVIAAFEAMWYGGAIFGSVSGAYKFNRDAWLEYVQDLKSRYDWKGENLSPP